MNRKTLAVGGMACQGCEETVENALKQVGGVTRVDADHEGDAVEVVVDDAVEDADLHAAVEQAGYDIPA